ncbi:MAG TPA: glycosyltransferase [Acidimicrobiales bacterium]|nr:glycosyltransferase [Acidimicrobiales bacterium]
MLSVVMPAFNEADFLRAAVGEVVAGLRARNRDAEVIVVENGSTDATAAVARELEEELAEVRALSLPAADYGAALRAGLLAARGDVVVNFDVDYFDLDFLDRAVSLIEAAGGPTIVVATKRGAGAEDQRAASRRLITWAFGAVLRLGFGLKVSDTHGMKAMRQAPLLGVVEACRFGTDLFDTELLLRAERAGLAVAEVPIVVSESRPSRTSIARRAVRTIGGLVRLRLALWREQARR